MADDTYLAIAAIARDEFMSERMIACTTQQEHLGNIVIPVQVGTPGLAPATWVGSNAYLWASSPGWGAAWKYALDSHASEADYEPGKDEAVITDAMILAAVQELLAEAPTG